MEKQIEAKSKWVICPQCGIQVLSSWSVVNVTDLNMGYDSKLHWYDELEEDEWRYQVSDHECSDVH